MRDVIKSVISAETEAKTIVAASRREAEAIISEARKKSEVILAQAQAEARGEAERVVEAALRQATEQHAAQLQEIAAGIEDQFRLENNVRMPLVQQALRCVCGLG